MPALVSRSTILVIATWCLVGFATSTATAQALCPEADAGPFRQAVVASLDPDPKTLTVEADVRALGDTLPGGSWRMPTSGRFDCDGLSLEGVSLHRHKHPDLESGVHTFDVVIELRARPLEAKLAAALDLVVADGDRQLRLGSFQDIRLRAGDATRVAQTISITKDDFDAFFAEGAEPTLRVTRWFLDC